MVSRQWAAAARQAKLDSASNLETIKFSANRNQTHNPKSKGRRRLTRYFNASIFCM